MKRLEIKNKESIMGQIQCYLDRNSESKFIHRLQVIRLFLNDEKATCDSLGELFGNSPRSISNWVRRVNLTGEIESLRDHDQLGHPSRLSAEQKNALKVVLGELPEKHGITGKRWNGKRLSSHISQQYGITLEVRACQRLLRKLNAHHSGNGIVKY